MRWFKHYSDNYRGRSINLFYRKYGHTGVAWYYLLTEICTEKLEKNKNKNITKEDCSFCFDVAFVESSLRGGIVKITRWLGDGEVMGLWKFKLTEFELCVDYPILLELLDSDHIKTRLKRDTNATHSPPDKDKERDRDKDKDAAAKSNEIINYLVKEKTSVEKFESRFSKDHEELLGAMRPKYGRRLNKYVSRILEHWGTKENFYAWASDVESSFLLKKETTISLESFIEVLIKKELGEIK